ncbi:MAG: glycosyltransferase family 4 protein [Thaumarchaeota archaeon]|nr:glycosyltransferase family 4 protein [Nitrososphaerota archaeon]
MTKLRVLIVTPSFPPLRNGTARLIGNIADSLSAGGSSVVVLTRRTGALPARESANGVYIMRISASSSFFGKISFVIQSLVLLAVSIRRWRIEVIHSVGTAALASSIFGSLFSRPIIVTFPGLPAESKRSGDPQRAVKTKARGILRVLSLFPRYATVPTKGALGPIVELCGERIAERIRVISNPMDVAKFSPSGRARPEGNFPEILVVGGLRSRKGVGTLIRALPVVLHEYPTLRVTLVGSGSFAPSLERLIQKLGIAGSIGWTGEVSDEQLIDRYEDSDVVVVPSLAGGEAFGYVVAEAMCMKKPVIASATPGPSEIITDANCGLLFPPGDQAELAALILRIARDDTQCRLFGENGRRYAEEHFDSKKVIVEFEDLYRKAIG